MYKCIRWYKLNQSQYSFYTTNALDDWRKSTQLTSLDALYHRQKLIEFNCLVNATHGAHGFLFHSWYCFMCVP